jgi:hypothetical protein
MVAKSVTNTSGVKVRVLKVTDRNKKSVEEFVGTFGEVEVKETFIKKTSDVKFVTKVRVKSKKGVRVAVEGDYVVKRGAGDYVVVKAADAAKDLGL